MQVKPQTRFLLRGSALLVTLLALWWFVLLNPMLGVLRGAAGTFVGIEDAADATNWSVSVGLDRILPATPEQPVAQQIHSIDFDLQHTDVIGFTFSLPLFWALMLAAPGLRRNLRPLALGTALMAVVELLLFLAFAQIAARNAYAHISGINDPTGAWLRHVGEYMIVGVLPFALPFVVALSLQRDLRAAIFPWSIEAATVAPPAPPEPPQAKRTKNRGQ